MKATLHIADRIQTHIQVAAYGDDADDGADQLRIHGDLEPETRCIAAELYNKLHDAAALCESLQLRLA